MRIILFLILGCNAAISFSQNTDLLMETHFNLIIENHHQNGLTNEDFQNFRTDDEVIDVLGRYLNHEKKVVQKEAIQLIALIGNNHHKLESRQKAVQKLLETVKEKESTLLMSIVLGLKAFKQSDFTSIAKAKITEIIQANQPHLKEFILLAGFLNMERQLEKIYPNIKNNSINKQALNLALTRCGNPHKVETLIEHLKNIPINDDFVHGVVPLLLYTRQKEVIDYVMDLILCDDYSCETYNHDNAQSMICAYRLVEMLAPVVEDFPVKVGISGDLVANDYPEALTNVREWITINKANYSLMMDGY